MGLRFDYIAGQTPINEEERNGLLISNLVAQYELDEFEQLNIERAIEWTIRTKFSADRILSEKFVKDLHKRMFGEVWKWAGTFRKTNKNIGVEWTQIGVQLKALLDDTRYWIRHRSFSEEEIAIRFKHRLVLIHCFSNGNGRYARLMADIMMESIFKKALFSWNQTSMAKPSETRGQYISALKQADRGNINPLLNFAQE